METHSRQLDTGILYDVWKNGAVANVSRLVFVSIGKALCKEYRLGVPIVEQPSYKQGIAASVA